MPSDPICSTHTAIRVVSMMVWVRPVRGLSKFSHYHSSAVESDYQLTVEDAWIVARHETVIFVDASIDAPSPFTVEVVEAKTRLPFHLAHV